MSESEGIIRVACKFHPVKDQDRLTEVSYRTPRSMRYLDGRSITVVTRFCCLFEIHWDLLRIECSDVDLVKRCACIVPNFGFNREVGRAPLVGLRGFVVGKFADWTVIGRGVFRGIRFASDHARIRFIVYVSVFGDADRCWSILLMLPSLPHKLNYARLELSTLKGIDEMA